MARARPGLCREGGYGYNQDITAGLARDAKPVCPGRPALIARYAAGHDVVPIRLRIPDQRLRRAQLDSQFEGDYSLRLHLAPPLLARKDPRTGAPRKITLGPRTLTLMKALARLKGLRGTWFDPFGHTAERRMERALVAEYRATVIQLLAGLSVDRLAQAATIAALAETVRGYGHVKQASVRKYRDELERQLRRYQEPTGSPDVSLRQTAFSNN